MEEQREEKNIKEEVNDGYTLQIADWGLNRYRTSVNRDLTLHPAFFGPLLHVAATGNAISIGSVTENGLHLRQTASEKSKYCSREIRSWFTSFNTNKSI